MRSRVAERSALYTRTSVARRGRIPRGLVCLSLLTILLLAADSAIATAASPKQHSQRARAAATAALSNLTLAPGTVSFPIQTIGKTSSAVTLTLSNYIVTAGVGVNTVAVTGDFAQTNTCSGKTLAQGTQCTIDVTFTPTASGARTGTLTISDSTGASLPAPLIGFGVQVGAGATITDIFSSGSAGAYTLNGVVIGTLTKGWPTGSVSFLDASNSNVSLGSATLGQPYSGLSIANGPSKPTGLEPSGVVTGDFNGDGKTDLAVLNNGAAPCGVGSLSIWLGNGDGTLTAAPDVPLGFCGSSVVAGDFNGDHKVDLAVGGGAGLTVLVGKGDGTFATSSVSIADSTGFLATGDFNDDGITDLAVVTGTISPYSAVILLGQTNGTFVTQPAIQALSANLDGVVAGDFNGDGKTDLAIVGDISSSPSNRYATVAVLLGNGDGTLQPAVITDATQSSFVPLISDQIAAAGDFNGDGKSDLVIAGRSTGTGGPDAILVLVSKGDGTFTAESAFTTDAANQGSNSVSVATADFNGDGKIDIAGLNDNVVQIYLSNGDGTFTPYVSVDSGAETVPDWLALAVGDFNGDGVPDLASIDSDANMETLTFVQRIHSATAVLQNVSIPGTGTHNIEASYEGDGTFGASTSVTIPLTATPVPVATLTPASLTFNGQAVGSTSAAQVVTLANTGTAALSISSITASGDFAETNTCGSSVAPAGNCTISVTFTPTASGARSGTLTITDNAAGSPQSIALSGPGTSITLTTSSTGGMTISSPGGSATATFQIGSTGGFSGTANLTCSVAYKGTGTPNAPPTCTLNPAQQQVSSSATANVTLTVNTTGASTAMLLRPLGGGTALAALAFLVFLPRRRQSQLAMLLVLVWAAATALTACGGSGKSSGSRQNAGTTAGSYAVTVTATSGQDKASTTVPLSVQ